MVGYHKRSDPAIEYVRSLMDEWNASGEFGNLRYIRISMPPGNWTGGIDMPIGTDEPVPPAEFESAPTEFSKEQQGDYDFFVNYYIHQVNMLRYLLGGSYRLTFGDRFGLLLVGESDSGVTVALETNTYSTTVEWHESILIAYANAYIKVDLPAPLARQCAGQVEVMRDKPGMGQPVYTFPVMPQLSAMRKQAMNFLSAVRGGRPAPCTAKEAVEDLKFAMDYVRYMARYKAENQQ
jgi:predicted dehydrogenase